MQHHLTFAAALALCMTAPGALAQNAAGADANAETSAIPREAAPDWAKLSEPLAVPDDAQGAIFVRSQDTIVRLTQDGSQSFLSQIVRVLQPQALQAGNIAIAWNPAAGSPRIHSLRIHRGSRVIDVLETAEFEILRREDQLEQAMLDGILTASLRVPDLRVGDDIELSYTVPLHDPTLKETSHGLIFLADAPPSGRFKLELTWEDGQEPGIRLSEDLEAIAEREADRITVRFDNPEAIAPPRDAPPR
jgi:hypothetical protein